VTHIIEASQSILVAAVLGLAGWIIHLLRQRHGRDRERDRKLDRLLQLFEGEPADPLANRPATPGVLGRIERLELRMAALETTVHSYHPARTRHEL
jgi:hypothetical protein